MRLRTRLPFCLLAFVALTAGGAGVGHAEIELRWELERSDVLQYERATVLTLNGEETLQKPGVMTIYGHDLRDGGQYMPVTPAVRDLAALLAFRLVPAGNKHAALKADWKLRGTVKIRVKGGVGICDVKGRVAHMEGTYTFQSRGKARPGDQSELRNGKATVECTFDAEGGYMRHARVDLDYLTEKLVPKKGEEPKRTRKTFDFALKDVKRFRYKAFQDEVNAAIDRGVKHLRTLQQADGHYKPHAKQKLGTTALAVLTLVACGVPRTDDAVSQSLDWIFRQEAKRTYEQGLCLMAIDRAYAPASEKLVRDAKGRIVRDIPADRLRWCMRTATALEKGNATPGSWSYPRSNTRLIPTSDSSNTQYAALGLRAATYLGYDVQEKSWMGLIRHFRQHRERKGPKGTLSLVKRGEAVPDERAAHLLNPVPVAQRAGFRYATHNPNHGPWASMTCAGIACLRVAAHHLEALGSNRLTPKLRGEIDGMVLGAWSWLDAHWGVDRHPGHHGNRWFYYYLYSLERAGIMDGVKRVGGRDWYFEGAVQLLARQNEKGAWNNPGKNETPQTCFALLFLKRGTTPLDGPGAPVVTGD